MTDIRKMIAEQRRDLAAVLADLPEQAWDAPTLCAGWRVREVVAHITAPFRNSPAEYELGTTPAEINELSDRLARREAAALTADELLADLRDNADHPWQPGDYTGALSHDVIHGLDITVPLGVGDPVPLPRLEVVLAALAPDRVGFFGADLTGVRLEATDLDWAYGDGEPRRAPAQDLLLVLCGRK